MFEIDQDAVESLFATNNNFRRLFDKHARLKAEVSALKDKTVAVDAVALERKKKQKLQVKDELAGIIRDYKAMHA